MWWLALLLLLPSLAYAQPTTVNLETISPVPTGEWDFEGGKIHLPETVFASLPAAGTSGRIYVVTDSSSCTSDVGTARVICRDTGATWEAIGSGGGGGGTECSTSPCDLDTATTLNSQGICLANGTNCPATYPTPTVVVTVTPTPVVCATNAPYGYGGLFKAHPEECKAIVATSTPTATATSAPTPTTTAFVCGAGSALDRAHPEACVVMPGAYPTPTVVLTATATPVVCATNAPYGLGGLFKANPEECMAVGPTPTATVTVTITPTPTVSPTAVACAANFVDGVIGPGSDAAATCVPIRTPPAVYATPTPVLTATATPLACETAAGGLLGGVYQAHPELCKAIPATPTPYATTTPVPTPASDPVLAANQCFWSATGIVCESTAADTNELAITVNACSADATVAIPCEDGTVCTSASVCTGYMGTATVLGVDQNSSIHANDNICRSYGNDTDFSVRYNSTTDAYELTTTSCTVTLFSVTKAGKITANALAVPGATITPVVTATPGGPTPTTQPTQTSVATPRASSTVAPTPTVTATPVAYLHGRPQNGTCWADGFAAAAPQYITLGGTINTVSQAIWSVRGEDLWIGRVCLKPWYDGYTGALDLTLETGSSCTPSGDGNPTNCTLTRQPSSVTITATNVWTDNAGTCSTAWTFVPAMTPFRFSYANRAWGTFGGNSWGVGSWMACVASALP